MGRPSKGKAKRGETGERKAQVARNEAAQEAAGVGGRKPKEPTLTKSKKAAKKHLDRKERATFEEIAANRLGSDTLSMLAALLVAQALKESRLVREFEKLIDKAKGADDPDEREKHIGAAEGVQQMLQEHRRQTRHLKAVSDAVAKLATSSAKLEIGQLPDELRIFVAGIWADIDAED